MDGLPLLLEQDPEDPDCAVVIVPAAMNGSERRFILDTGAATTTVAFDEVTARFPSAGRRESVAAFGPVTSELVTVGELSLGPISLAQLDVCRSQADAPGARDLLGMDVCSRGVWYFSFSESFLGVDLGDPAGRPAARLPLERYEHGQPALELDFGECSASAVWDSGAGITVVDTAFVEAHSDLFELGGSANGSDAAGKSLETPLGEMAPCVVGASHLPSSKVAVVDLRQVSASSGRPIDLILGYTTYHHADWVFDFPGNSFEVRA